MRTAFGAGLLVLMATMTLAATEDATAARATARATHKEIAAHLDTGGDLYVVANLQGVVQDVTATLGALLDAAAASERPAAPIAPRLADFMSRSGLDAIGGYGLSSVPRADGLHNVKDFLLRDPKAAGKPFWQAMVGGQPRPLASLDYLPRDTVMVCSGTGDPAALWLLLRQGFESFGDAAGRREFARMEKGLAQIFGTNANAVVEALGDESFFSLQLASGQTVSLPLPAAPDAQPGQLTLPTPSLLLGIEVRDTVPARALAAALTRSGLPLERPPAMAGATLVTVRPPVALPFPFSLTCGQHEGMLLIGSTPEVVQSALRARGARDGLIADTEFRASFAGLPAANNGIVYIHPRFAATMREAQQAMAKAGGNEAMARLQGLMIPQDERSAIAIVNEESGIATMGVNSSGGRRLISQLILAPVGILAGIAVPNFVNARSQAQAVACRNNLRMIEAAKEQWAMEHNKTDADTPTPEDIARFLKDGRLPRCPRGGKYTIGALDTAPTCSLPEHKLR